MSKAVFPSLTDLHSLMHHARQVVVDMRLNLVKGARPELACAMALASLESWRLATARPKSRDPLEREKFALVEAITIAVHYFQAPDMIATIGEAQAAAKVEMFTQLLLDLTGP